MSETGDAIWQGVRWELLRWRRSQRLWLLLIPPVAGPIGSAVADLYLHIPSVETARILGLLITGGLAALIALDLTALSVGEDLALRVHLFSFTLPERRSAGLAGRLIDSVGAPLAAYALGAAGVWAVGGALVTESSPVTAIFPAARLAVAIPMFLVFIVGVTAAAAVYTRSSAQALVAGVLAVVAGAGATADLLLQNELTIAFPALLALAGVGALGWSLIRYPHLEG